MRELDLLLEKFLATGLQSLEGDDLDRLERLLVQPDQDILAWLTSDPKPDDAEIRRIIEILRGRIYTKVNSDE